ERRGVAQLADPLVVDRDVVERVLVRREVVRALVVLDRGVVVLALVGVEPGLELRLRSRPIVGARDARRGGRDDCEDSGGDRQRAHQSYGLGLVRGSWCFGGSDFVSGSVSRPPSVSSCAGSVVAG